MTARAWRPVAVPVALALLGPALYLAHGPLWLRGPVVAAFFLVAPGWLLARPLRLSGPAAVAIVPVLSLSVVAAVSLVDIYLLGWSIPVSVLLVAALVLAGSALVVLRASRPGRTGTADRTTAPGRSA